MALFTHVDYAIQIYVGGSMKGKDFRRVSSHALLYQTTNARNTNVVVVLE